MDFFDSAAENWRGSGARGVQSSLSAHPVVSLRMRMGVTTR